MSDVSNPARSPATAGGGSPACGRVGMFPPYGLLEQGPLAAQEFLTQVADEGVDHVCCGDHVSFAGMGYDGLVQATGLRDAPCHAARLLRQAPAMEPYYQLPFERFERYCPYGTGTT